MANLGPTVQKILEEVRQEQTGDKYFYRHLLYFFELIVPREIGGLFGTSFLFPLVINPEEITFEEPLAVEATPTQGSGLYVEEGGIVQRVIRIRGHTGFKPRKFRGGFLFALQAPPAGRSYRREVIQKAFPAISVSGQRHFQFLQDTVIRTYADLKRDPTTNKDTQLRFHNTRDQESWLVAPRRFVLTRSKANKVLYHYDIELLVKGPADLADAEFSEEKSLWDKLKDGLRKIKNAIDTITGLIQDVTALVAEIKSFIENIGQILESFVGIIDACSDFVNGVSDFIRTPFEVISSLEESLDTAFDKLDQAISTLPGQSGDAIALAHVANNLRKGQEALFNIRSHPEFFQPNLSKKFEEIQRGQEYTTSRDKLTLEEAAAESPPNSFQALLAKGTANMPGDAIRARGELGVGRAFDEYKSVYPITVQKGDTLGGLAAKHLGDARKWRHIAIANKLEQPYLSDAGLPKTLRRGQELLIPSRAKPPEQRTLVPVLGVTAEKSADEKMYGTDFALERVPGDQRNRFDIPIDTANGSTDVKLVRGKANLVQAITQRVRTERGHDPLFSRFGMRRVVGLSIPAIDQEMIRFRISEAILADPRIVAVRSIELSRSSPLDTVDAEVSCEALSLSGTQPVTIEVN